MLTKPGPYAPKNRPKVVVPRLPPSSSKIHLWTGTIWEGQFQVLGEIFNATEKSEKMLLWKLDELYRSWLATQPAEVKSKHTEHLK